MAGAGSAGDWRFSTRRCDHVVATTTELRDEVARDLRVSPNEIALIPKCVDLQAYTGVPLGTRERAILHSGTAAYKDPGATIRAFGALDDPSVTLYLGGEVTEPVQEAVATLPDQLRRCVVLLGEADRTIVRALYGRVRVAAFPTRYTIPVASSTVMEAVAAATPIVGSAHLSRDVLADGVNGIVTDTEPGAMAAALSATLNNDKLWSRLSAAARRMVEAFDSVRIAWRYIDLASHEGATWRGSSASPGAQVRRPVVRLGRRL